MDKNTLVGFALIGAVVIGFSIYNRPSQEEMARAKFRLYLYVLWRKPRCGTANDTGK